MKILSENKKAYFNHEILEQYEAGIVLLGHEVKSIRSGKASLKGAYVILKDEEVFLIGASIPPYQPKNTPSSYDPERTRKLLLNKEEIKTLIGKTKQKGFTLIPLKLYTKDANIKLAFGLAKGKQKQDKRQDIKKKESDRKIERELKSRG